MKCESTQQWLTAYLTGKLPIWRRTAVSLHIRRCNSCALEANELSEITSLLTQSLNDDPELELEPHRIRELFKVALGNVVPFSLNTTRRPSHLKAQFALAAAVLLTIALGSYIGFNFGKSQVQVNVAEEKTVELNLTQLTAAKPKFAMKNIHVEKETLETSPGYGLDDVGTLFSSDPFTKRLPEYGMGNISFASQPRKAIYPYPYHGVPGPRPSYTAHDRSEPIEE